MFRAISDGFEYLYQLLIDGFMLILNGIMWLLQPILDVINIIFDFIYWIGLIIVKIVVLVFGVAKFLIGLLVGLAKTIAGFGYSGGTHGVPSSYMQVYAKIQPIMDRLQMDKIAYLVLFGIIFITAFAATKIISSMGAGSGE